MNWRNYKTYLKIYIYLKLMPESLIVFFLIPPPQKKNVKVFFLKKMCNGNFKYCFKVRILIELLLFGSWGAEKAIFKVFLNCLIWKVFSCFYLFNLEIFQIFVLFNLESFQFFFCSNWRVFSCFYLFYLESFQLFLSV